jgi:hypothetical protein
MPGAASFPLSSHRYFVCAGAEDVPYDFKRYASAPAIARPAIHPVVQAD